MKREYNAWDRARLIAHAVYMFTPSFSKDKKETDRRKFFPLLMDNSQDEKPEKKPKAMKITKVETEALENIFKNLK